MLFSTWTVKDKDYKLRLSTGECVSLEKALGTNPINILTEVADNRAIPSLGILVKIIHHSLLQFQHGLKESDVYAILDEYFDDGHSLIDVLPIVIDVFKVSGLIPENSEELKN